MYVIECMQLTYTYRCTVRSTYVRTNVSTFEVVHQLLHGGEEARDNRQPSGLRLHVPNVHGRQDGADRRTRTNGHLVGRRPRDLYGT